MTILMIRDKKGKFFVLWFFSMNQNSVIYPILNISFIGHLLCCFKSTIGMQCETLVQFCLFHNIFSTSVHLLVLPKLQMKHSCSSTCFITFSVHQFISWCFQNCSHGNMLKNNCLELLFNVAPRTLCSTLNVRNSKLINLAHGL